MANKKEKCDAKELEFAKLISEGFKPAEAYSKVWKIAVNAYTPEAQKAKDLARSSRVKEAIKKYQNTLQAQAQAKNITLTKGAAEWDSIYQFAFDRLINIRDDKNATARVRFQAISALDKLQDPAQDVNLIWKWVDLVWPGLTGHCPCCHSNFPLSKVKNAKLYEWRNANELVPVPDNIEDFVERRLYLLRQAEKRRVPHKGQMKALRAQERHVVGRGSARAGKSFLLGMFTYLFGLLPGVEIWILAATYDDAQSEVEYLENFLTTAFYPLHEHVFTSSFDKKTGEASIITKWGSTIKVKSGKSKHSITGRELEAILVAEPGWVDGDLFEEVRARMSSRLGRIITLGTPKGFGGFLGRLISMTSRDMRTGKKLAPGSRLIENGCKWSQSIMEYPILPEDNPEYVKSEIETAKSELTKAEYESEFEGKMTNEANAKFPQIKDEHLLPIKRETYQDLYFVTGIDQGERNFGSCTLGWDGHTVYVVGEYFNGEEGTTIKANLIKLNATIPAYLRLKGGSSEHWAFTIFDADPPIHGQLEELEKESRPWKTDYTFRPKNKPEFMNWREETCLWANQLAAEGRLIFASEETDLLHEQLKDALIKPRNEESDSTSITTKGWVIKDRWRGDHVCDAWLLAMWAVFNKCIDVETKRLEGPVDNFEVARQAFDYRRLMDEKRELNGGISPTEANELFEKSFGYSNPVPARHSWYSNEG